MNIFTKVKNFIVNVKNKAQEAKVKAEELKLKAVAFIIENKEAIQGFIKLASFLYATQKGSDKMENVIKMVTATVTGAEYTNEQAKELRLDIEDKVQFVYDEMHSKGLV